MEKTHRSDTAIERPAFQKMRFPSHQLADQVAHAPGAANQRRFFDDFSDAFLERFWVDFGVPFGAILGLKRIQNNVENQCKNQYRKRYEK